jgi:hypothetical protein
MTKFIFTLESDKMEFGNKVYMHTKELIIINKRSKLWNMR